jgi:hypothetical protein
MKTQLKAVRLEKTIMDELLPIMKKKKAGFSALVTEALEDYIKAQHFSEAVNTGYGAWKDKDHPELIAGTDSYIRKLRKARKL